MPDQIMPPPVRDRLTLAEIFSQGSRLLQAPPDAAAMRIVVAGSATTDLIARAVAVGCLQEGLPATVTQAPFGAWRQEALDPASALHRAEPDLVVLATDWRDGVRELPLDATPADVDRAVAAAAADYRAVWDALARPGRRIVQHLPAAPPAGLSGIAELRLAASPRRQVAALRQALLEAGPEIVFLDPEPLGSDARTWFAARLPFPQDRLPDYALMFRAALRCATGRAKKVLALDLDHTLWGGVIGDDGVEGIRLGPDSPAGEAFQAFQRHARDLGARGIVLAVCSKNEPAVAELGLGHPQGVLRRDDFAAFECSWSDKAAGLRRIAETLNVGLQAIVFADDNPAECALVRETLPEVAVVELGADPATFVARLEEGRWFDVQSLLAEDFARAGAYQARAQAQAAQPEGGDLGGFLSGLAMHGRVFVPEGAALARIAQLEAKTNQFNLTTRRHDEATVRAYAARPDAVVLGATLRDRFGDHGLVSSLIAVRDGDALVIESWLMSCRVFSRTLELFMLRALLREASRRGVARLVGEYIETPKNAVVAGLYDRLGFTPLVPGRLWERATDTPADDLASPIIEEAEA